MPGGGLALLVVGGVIDGIGEDLGAENAAGCIPFIDGELHRLPHLDAEAGGASRQRTADADMDFLAGELRNCLSARTDRCKGEQGDA